MYPAQKKEFIRHMANMSHVRQSEILLSKIEVCNRKILTPCKNVMSVGVMQPKNSCKLRLIKGEQAKGVCKIQFFFSIAANKFLEKIFREQPNVSTTCEIESATMANNFTQQQSWLGVGAS